MNKDKLTWKYKEKYGSRAHLFEDGCAISICGTMTLDKNHPPMEQMAFPTCAVCRDLKDQPAEKRSLKGSPQAEIERLRKSLRQVYTMIPDVGTLWAQKTRTLVKNALKEENGDG